MNRLLSLLLALAASALLLIGLLAGSRSESVHAQQGDVATPTPTTEPGPVFDIQILPTEGKISPPKYPNLDSDLNHIIEQARTGQLTARAAAANAPIHREESVAVTLYITEGYAQDVWDYLEQSGASPRNIGADYIEAYIPVSLLVEASKREGVVSIRTIIPPHPDQGTIVSGGVAAHGVPSWHAAGFKGRDVKIGVIDLSFKGFAGLMGSELPATVQARCYASVGNFTTNLSDCISTSSPAVDARPHHLTPRLDGPLLHLTCVETQGLYPLKCQGKVSPPVNCHAIRLRYRRLRAPARHRWTFSIHILLHVVSVYAQFPGDPTNGQPLALRFPHRSPSRRLKWCGLPLARSHSVANSSGAIAEGLVRHFFVIGYGVHPFSLYSSRNLHRHLCLHSCNIYANSCRDCLAIAQYRP